MPKKRTTNRDHACLVRFHGEVSSPERIRKRQQRSMMEDAEIAAQHKKPPSIIDRSGRDR